MPYKILWLPTPPSEGCASMDRYWRELEREFRAPGLDEFEVRCALGDAPAATRQALRLLRIWNKYFRLPRLMGRTGDAQIAHVLDHSSAHFLQRIPAGVAKIVTVHDLAPLEDPDGLTPAQLDRFRRTVSNIRLADLLLADSAHTARAITAFLREERNVQVLPLGVRAEQFARPGALRRGLVLPQCPRVLSVGSTLRRKNLRILPDVLGAVRNAIGPVALIRVGARLDETVRGRLHAAIGPESVVELGHCADDELVALFHQADLLLFPSTLEGFGLPILEAMAAGCPVVSSDASSLPEVGGDDVLSFRPEHPSEATAQIVSLLRQPRLREDLIERGRRRAAEFSWTNHAEKLAGHYRALAEITKPQASARWQKDRERQ